MVDAGAQRQRECDLAAAIAASPLFSALSPQDPQLDSLGLIHLPAGAELFRQGDSGELAYLVADGVLGLYRNEQSRETRLFRKACRGELIGEYALLCDEPRSATGRALVDCRLFTLDRAALQRLLQLRSELPSRLIRQLALAASRGREDLGSRPLITVLAPGHQLLEAADPALDQLVGALRQNSGVAIGDHRGRPWSSDAQSTAVVAALENRQPSVFVVDRLDVVDRVHWPLVDRALLLCRGNALEVDDVCASTAGTSVDLVRIWPPEQELPEPLAVRDRLACLRHVYNVREDRPADFRRTARCILGMATVLVLGGGGAKGFAHLGALRALREHGEEPIDMIFGISIGAFIGSLYALEYPLETIRRILIELFVKQSPYSLTLPIHSLFRYNHNLRKAEQILRREEVGDTWIPFRPGSVDITSNQLVIWHAYPLVQTVIASMSIPGLAPPVAMPSGGLHVDGAVLDNLPILEARRCTSGRVIAISLDHGEGQRTLETRGRRHPWLWHLLHRLGLVREELPSITMTILQSMLCSARLKSDREERFANLLLKPNLTAIGILEWSAHERVEQEGYRPQAPGPGAG